MNTFLPPLFRAEPFHDGLHVRQYPRATVRLPSNVPYVVDNLWAYLKPESMPNRRHALYASPTRTLAMANRSGKDKGQGFCVYRLQLAGECKVAQLRVKDAREHTDISAVLRLVQELLPTMDALVTEEKVLTGVLFRPGATPGEWNEVRAQSSFAERFISSAAALSTFWSDASSNPVDAAGELFFELLGGSYEATDLERYNATSAVVA